MITAVVMSQGSMTVALHGIEIWLLCGELGACDKDVSMHPSFGKPEKNIQNLGSNGIAAFTKRTNRRDECTKYSMMERGGGKQFEGT